MPQRAIAKQKVQDMLDLFLAIVGVNGPTQPGIIEAT